MENGQIKVSIVVPVFNGEATMARCINSILGQNLTELELIIVDDGSTDRTGEICRDCQDARIRYIRKENGGVSTARNAGIRAARGEYIGFVDADDYIAPEMCEKMYNAGVESGADICVCDYQIVFADGRKTAYTDLLRGGHFGPEQIRAEVLPHFLAHIDENGDILKYDWAIVRRFFRRDFLVRNGLLFNETLSNSEDCLFAYLATDLAAGMVYLKEQQLYINMRSTGSLTRRYLPDYWQQRCCIIDTLEVVVNGGNPAWQSESFPLFVMRCVRPSFTNIAYGFAKGRAFRSMGEFRAIVRDPRVRKMCDAWDGRGVNSEWKKLYDWCRERNWLTLYLYYMDVQQGDRLCHQIRRVQKGIDRRLKK